MTAPEHVPAGAVEASIACLCEEIRRSARPAHVLLAATAATERLLIRAFQRHGGSLSIELRIYRAQGRDERKALGILLRALSRDGPSRDEAAILYDLNDRPEQGRLLASLALMAACPDSAVATPLQPAPLALASAGRLGGVWLADAKARMGTGGCLVFRARYATAGRVIRTVEAGAREGLAVEHLLGLANPSRALARAVSEQAGLGPRGPAGPHALRPARSVPDRTG
jgi:hypothetical protein